tara:strand:+ start:3886 stop:4224 length:339 start_codon:yes stop_codon:yes gene_type:complete
MNYSFLDLPENEIINLCGEFPNNFQEIDIASNPDFIFENDIEYEAVRLFDIEENSVFVNSFVECHHYVNGGWNYLPFERYEGDYHDILIGFSIIIIITANFLVRKMGFAGSE